MDFAKAATYPFEDPDWLKKLGIGVLVSILLFIPVVNLAVGILFHGWAYDTARRVRANTPNPLASWDDFGGIFSRGLMIWLAQIVYVLPFLLFVCVAILASGGLATLGGAAASSSESAQNAGGALAGFGQVLALCCYCLGALYVIAAMIVFAGGYVRYLDKPEFSTFMAFGENLALVRANAGDFLMAAAFIVVAQIVVSLFNIIPILGALCMIPVSTYFDAHIIAQLANKLSGAAKPAM